MYCKLCKKELPPKHVNFCTTECASIAAGKKRYERVCSGCKKVEYVSNSTQLKRQCRSCSQMGNTHSQNMSEEARKKISEARKSRDPWNKGKKDIYSQEVKIAMGAKNKGRIHSEDEKKKRIASMKAHYAENGSELKGRKLKSQHKEKISNSLRNIKAHRTVATFHDVEVFCRDAGITLNERRSPDSPMGMHDIVKLKCKCGKLYKRKWQNISLGYARSCRGCLNTTSGPEIELVGFLIEELGIDREQIKTNVRLRSLAGKELDIYLPEYNFAIEFHGLAYHSERDVFNKKLKMTDREWATHLSFVKYRHYEKYMACKIAGIKLIQIFEDEWKNNPEAIKSIIRQKLGLTSKKLNARECELKGFLANDIELAEFFGNTHISGNTKFKMGFGLELNGELVAGLSLRESWNKKYGNVIEIARFSTKLGVSVRGGFSKLLKAAKEWAVYNGYQGILTYSDRRFGDGGVYSACGFLAVDSTKVGYFYERGGIRESRFSHRKRSDLPGDTEREQQNLLGWYAIYDAGHEVYLLNLVKN